MSLFLTTVSVDEGVRVAQSLARPMPAEWVPLPLAFGRTLAEDIRADTDIPGFTRSSVDGYAVRSRDTAGSSESLPALFSLDGRVGMGDGIRRSLSPDACVYVPTGGELPGGADAVVMVEFTETIGGDVLVKKPVAPGENVVMKGEDFHRDEVVLARGRYLSTREIAALAASGAMSVPVTKRPRVGVLSTGNELVPAGAIPEGNQVRDINRWLCGAFLTSAGCLPEYLGIIRDDRAALGDAIRNAATFCDALVISGGSSKDERDLTADLIRESGEVLVHGIALSPGKPTIIGRTGGIPVIGLPGHPASAFVVLLVIARPLLDGMTGRIAGDLLTRRVVLGQNIPSARGREDYVRVRIREGKAYPEFGKSGLVNTLVRSDGIIRIPSGLEGLEEGDTVEVIPW